MQDYQRHFLNFAVEKEVLRFGEFTLKSGRLSPYFFNTGLFNTGGSLAQLGRYYARAIVDSGIEFDILYGPAYKGIPLAAVTSAALYDEHQRDVAYAFNRKEAKDHGEGGVIVGHPLQGKVLIIDDVISAGTSVRESVDIIHRRMPSRPESSLRWTGRSGDRGINPPFRRLNRIWAFLLQPLLGCNT